MDTVSQDLYGTKVSTAGQAVEKLTEAHDTAASPSQTLLERLKEIRRQQEWHRRQLLHFQTTGVPSPLSSLSLSVDSSGDLDLPCKDDSLLPQPPPAPHHNQLQCEDNDPQVIKGAAVTAQNPHPSQIFLCTGNLQAITRKAIDSSEQRGSGQQIPESAVNHEDLALVSQQVNMSNADWPSELLVSPAHQIAPDKLTDDDSSEQPPLSSSTTISEGSSYASSHRVKSDSHSEETTTSVSSFYSTAESSSFSNVGTTEQDTIPEQRPYYSEKYSSNAKAKTADTQSLPSTGQERLLIGPPKRLLQMTKDPQEVPKMKHKFLRKGQGTSRFGMRPVRLRKQGSSASEGGKCATEGVATTCVDQLKPTQVTRVAPPVTNGTKLPVKNLQLQEISKGEQRQTLSKQQGFEYCHTSVSPKSLNPDLDFDKQKLKEQKELSAFEKLEELAENSSFSSNSSTVWHLLKQGNQSVSSTPIRTPPPFFSQETPIPPQSDLPQPLDSNPGYNILLKQVEQLSKDSVNPTSVQGLSVSQVLQQLKALVNLGETADASEISEDLQTFLQSFSEHQSHFSPEIASQFAHLAQQASAAHPTSTPTYSQPPSKHQVHFPSEGVYVLEYEPSEPDEDTLTDAPSLNDYDSDLITTSDLEALSRIATQAPLPRWDGAEQARAVCGVEEVEIDHPTHGVQGQRKGLQPLALQFSPPPYRLPNSASDYITAIFGSEKNATKKTKDKKDQPSKSSSEQPISIGEEKQKHNNQNQSNIADNNEEIKTYKTLLLAKVNELENETKIFKKKNSKLTQLINEACDKENKQEEDRKRLQEETEKEKKKFQEYIDRERNALWKEKQRVAQQTPTAPPAQPQQSLEVVYLKEQLHDMQEEQQKKEALHQFTVRKLNDKIKALEEENKTLKEKNLNLQRLERENLELRQRLNARMAKKQLPSGQATSKPQPHVKPRGATVDGVNRDLERMAVPKSRVNYEGKNGPPGNQKSKRKALVPRVVQFAKGDKESRTEGERNNENNYSSVKDKQERELHLVSDNSSVKPLDILNSQDSSEKPVRGDVSNRLQATLTSPDNINLDFTEYVRGDGTKEVIYSNGNKKEIRPDGAVIVSYYNGDRKEIHNDRTVYIYGTDSTSHTTYTDGREVLTFPNGQTETRFCDGSSEILFPDGSQKVMQEDGTEVCTLRDGTVVRTNPDGSKVFEFVSGQREVHLEEGEKRREYPDGTVKILHLDGRTETRYRTGRVRIKDAQGNIISDSRTGGD